MAGTRMSDAERQMPPSEPKFSVSTYNFVALCASVTMALVASAILVKTSLWENLGFSFLQGGLIIGGLIALGPVLFLKAADHTLTMMVEEPNWLMRGFGVFLLNIASWTGSQVFKEETLLGVCLIVVLYVYMIALFRVTKPKYDFGIQDGFLSAIITKLFAINQQSTELSLEIRSGGILAVLLLTLLRNWLEDYECIFRGNKQRELEMERDPVPRFHRSMDTFFRYNSGVSQVDAKRPKPMFKSSTYTTVAACASTVLTFVALVIVMNTEFWDSLHFNFFQGFLIILGFLGLGPTLAMKGADHMLTIMVEEPNWSMRALGVLLLTIVSWIGFQVFIEETLLAACFIVVLYMYTISIFRVMKVKYDYGIQDGFVSAALIKFLSTNHESTSTVLSSQVILGGISAILVLTVLRNWLEDTYESLLREIQVERLKSKRNLNARGVISDESNPKQRRYRSVGGMDMLFKKE